MAGFLKKLFAIMLVVVSLTLVLARPDSAGHPPEGFAYGGIPYGSMSGNVAEFYKMPHEAESTPVKYVPTIPTQQNFVYPSFYNHF